MSSPGRVSSTPFHNRLGLVENNLNTVLKMRCHYFSGNRLPSYQLYFFCTYCSLRGFWNRLQAQKSISCLQVSIAFTLQQATRVAYRLRNICGKNFRLPHFSGFTLSHITDVSHPEHNKETSGSITLFVNLGTSGP